MSRALSFQVAGVPIPQGSKNAMPHPKIPGKIVMFEASAVKLKPWRDGVALLARNAIVRHGDWLPLESGVVVGLRFYMPRPVSVPRRRRPLMIVKPDIDKLTRAVLDALKTGRVYADDSKVVELHVYKKYADECPPGVFITVEEAGTQE